MKTIKIVLYSFSELSIEVQAKVLNNLRDINIDHDWYDSDIEDAKNISLEIKKWDIEYNHKMRGEFVTSAPECAELILKGHGENCQTFKTAKQFLKDLEELEANFTGKEDDQEREDALCELEDTFLSNILADYRKILCEDYEYLTSDEAIIEAIDINDYTFESDGAMRNA